MQETPLTLTIDSQNYAEAASATACDYVVVAERLTPDNFVLLDETLSQIIAISRTADVVKKKLFYGKEIVGLVPRAPIHIPDGEILDRTKQQDVLVLLHCLLGIASEINEALVPVLSHILYDKPIDYVNLKEESGDACWYLAHMIDRVFHTTLTEVLQTNINKLAKRYPQKFTDFHANHRDLAGEREILEAAELFLTEEERQVLEQRLQEVQAGTVVPIDGEQAFDTLRGESKKRRSKETK